MNFEGVIPPDNYGAGAVIVWDRGRWVALNDIAAGFDKGKLLFELRGHKLRGKWTLVKTKRGKNEWLLIKERDAYATDKSTEDYPADSVLSGRTVEQVAGGDPRGAAVAARLRKLGAARRELRARDLKPMLAMPGKPFSDPRWVFELKYDGYRLFAEERAGEVKLYSRAGLDFTTTFPEIAEIVAALPFEQFILDTEVVVLDERGLPSFALLQKRGRLTRRADVARAALELPASLYAFDLLAFEGFDLRASAARRAQGRVARAAAGRRVRCATRSTSWPRRSDVRRGRAHGARGHRRQTRGVAVRQQALDRLDQDQRGEVRRLRRRRLLAAEARRQGLRCAAAGAVPRRRADVRGPRGQRVSRRATSPCSSRMLAGEAARGAAGRGRRAARRRLARGRARRASEVQAPHARRHAAPTRVLAAARRQEARGVRLARRCSRRAVGARRSRHLAVAEPPERPTVAFTNLDKVFWPADGYTKGDLIAYYEGIAEWLLPYLKDRPVVLTRYPDGIDGKSFFQKDAPVYAPSWLRLETMWSEHAEREIRYFVLDDVESLLYVANMGTIPLHVWSSRVAALERPDWCILDLDPKGAPLKHVIEIARHIHALCEDVGLTNFVKTSGSTGLHVLIPLGARYTYEQSRTLAELLARFTAKSLPEIATIVRSVSDRDGKVYLDYLQNGHGRLLVSPFCVRPLPAAPVSMPLEWSQINGRLKLERFNIRSARKWLRTHGDPLAAVLTESTRHAGRARGAHAPARGVSGRRATC